MVLDSYLLNIFFNIKIAHMMLIIEYNIINRTLKNVKHLYIKINQKKFNIHVKDDMHF